MVLYEFHFIIYDLFYGASVSLASLIPNFHRSYLATQKAHTFWGRSIFRLLFYVSMFFNIDE